MVDLWYGVFSPKGELESVEQSPGLAADAARELSPGRGAHKHVNRSVRPVTVIDGMLDDVISRELFNAALRTLQKRNGTYEKTSARLAKDLESARNGSSLSSSVGHFWQDNFDAYNQMVIAGQIVTAIANERNAAAPSSES